MKRDMDLIRLIMLREEGDDSSDLSSYSDEQTNYHIALLIEANYLDGKTHYSSRGGKNSEKIPDFVHIKKITWNGHEFLDQARSNSTWEKAKKYLSDKGQSLSIDSIKIALGVVIKGALR